VHNNAVAHSASVEFLQNLLHFGILLFHGDQRFLDSFQAFCLVGFVRGAGLVFLLSVVLNLLAAVLHLRQTECGRGAFQEMAERRELREISSLPVGGTDYSISVILSAGTKKIDMFVR
jgi:hypothetical protein